MINNPQINQKIKKLSMLGYPFNATFELTSRCNLSCKYCYVDNSVKELDTDDVKTVIDRLDQSGVCTLLLTGGEPFVRDDIIDILSFAFDKNFFEIYILSNGTLLRKEHLDFLSRHTRSLNLFRITFFSHIPDIHDSFAGKKGSFDKSFKNALALSDAGIRTNIIINTIEENVDDIQTTMEFFQSFGLTVQIGKSKLMPTQKIKDEFSDTISEEFYNRYYKNLCKKNVLELKCRLEKEIHQEKSSDLLCEGLFGLISIRSDGSITPCLTFRNLSIGNILYDLRPLHQIYSTSDIYQTLKKIKRSEIEKCKDCKFKNVCVICPGLMHSETGSFKEPSPMFCNMVKALDKIEI